MLCKEIIQAIEAVYPPKYAMDWDNVGLLAGRIDKEVSNVYIALDLTEQVIEDAIETKADMIITHHPLIFSPLRAITNEHFIGNRVVTLLQHDISYYAMHTNYDILRMAELAAERFGLQNVQTLDVIFEEEERKGIGSVGTYCREVTLEECCNIVKERFQLDRVKVFGDLNQKVSKIAISPGSGKSEIGVSICKGADVLITGDIGHHEGIDAVAQGLAVIDAGHYGLEHIYMEDMEQFLTKTCSEIKVQTASIQQPFQLF